MFIIFVFSSQETAGDEEITAMPTFKYFKNGAEVRHALAIINGIIITTTIIIVIFVIIILGGRDPRGAGQSD